MSFKYGASITQRCNLIYKNEKTASIECVGRPRKEFAKLNRSVLSFCHSTQQGGKRRQHYKIVEMRFEYGANERNAILRGQYFACRCALPERENRLFPVQDRRETKCIQVNGATRLKILYSRDFA